MARKETEQYSEEEAARRFKEAIQRAVTTPHKPQKELVGKTLRAKTMARRRAAKADPKS
jgi:hypothetical protein